MNQIPEIRIDRDIPTLYVDGKPFQAFAGEVHNSAAYDSEKMEKEIWQKMDQNHLNTLIVPVYWETLEPEEGRYDFALADALLEQAARYEKKLILLWFGLWKNAESAYVPVWMKTDTETYFRAEMYGGERLNTISPLCMAAVEKDAAAFARLMAHIRETDRNHTVIMMQVENEVGLLGTERDYCSQAERLFAGPVPERLLDAAEKAGWVCTEEICAEKLCTGKIRAAGKSGWAEIFGEDASEIFSAWCFASALEKIASAGRTEYSLPCYANVWLKQFPWYAGSYPSGGPVEDMLWVWKAAAPSLCTIAPDIYVSYVPDIMETYCRPDNPLLIPEVRKDAVTASYAFYAFMNYHALCYAPFGIEDLWREEPFRLPAEVMDALKLDPLSFDLTGTKEALGEVYRLLGELQPLYLKYRGTPHLKCFLKKAEGEQGCYLKFCSYDIEIQYFPQNAGAPVSAGAVFELDENRFLIIGMMCSVRFHTKPGSHEKAEYLRKETGTYRDGEWTCGQRQNGDEKMVTMMYSIPGCVKVDLFRY